MSLHLAAKPGDIAETVLISGDPLRIEFMANMFLQDAFCFNEIRGMLGFTGTFKGKRISMLGTGIGIPTTALFMEELATYGVKNIIRVGTMGAFAPELEIGDLVLAMGACTDSNVNKIQFKGLDFAPIANFSLLVQAEKRATKMNMKHVVGNIFSTDSFYADESRWEPWIAHQVLGVEMETAIIYTIAARHNIRALSILTVSDNISSGTSSTPEERESQFKAMFELALEMS